MNKEQSLENAKYIAQALVKNASGFSHDQLVNEMIKWAVLDSLDNNKVEDDDDTCGL